MRSLDVLLLGMLSIGLFPEGALAQDMQGMDHASMQHPAHAGHASAPAPSTSAPTPATTTAAPPPDDASPGMPMHDMPMHYAPATAPTPPDPNASGHDMSSMGDMHDMPMGPMQGGRAPADARSPDWSDGIAPASMHDMASMDMDDTAPVGMFLLDRLESFAVQEGHGQSWEAKGWYGNDTDKLGFRSEGEREGGRPHDGDAELLWSHAVATFWDTQLGIRRDLGDGPKRTWAAVGVQGLAPYWFELEATAYAGQGGRTAARVRAEYELLITQRLILQPEVEVNAYGKDDIQRGLRAGVSSIEGGLRLRYEIRRSIAPYVGVSWEHLTGGTADLARDTARRITDRRWVAGIRLWW